MLDLLFRMFYSAFHNKGNKGAEAGVILLMAPLSFNIYLLILIALSFVTKVSELGGIIFSGGLGLTALTVLYFLRKRYVTQERYKLITVEYPVLFCLAGAGYFVISNIAFAILSYVILSSS